MTKATELLKKLADENKWDKDKWGFWVYSETCPFLIAQEILAELEKQPEPTEPNIEDADIVVDLSGGKLLIEKLRKRIDQQAEQNKELQAKNTELQLTYKFETLSKAIAEIEEYKKALEKIASGQQGYGDRETLQYIAEQALKAENNSQRLDGGPVNGITPDKG